MPLPERVIEPVSVCRGTLQMTVPDELEGVTNGSLANIIRQLSFLSRHAEEMFGNLFQEAEGLAVRGSSLQARIDKIAVKVTQLDSNVEEVTLQEIQLRKAFRSSQQFDQQVVSRETMPKSMLEQYLGCDKPPPLDKLNPYREDGKDGIKFYTDANYFFDLWRSEMLQSTEKAEKGKRGGIRREGDRGVNRKQKRVRQPTNTAERHREKVLKDGEYIMSHQGQHRGNSQGLSVHFQTPDQNGYGGSPDMYDPGRQHRPNSIEIQGMDSRGALQHPGQMVHGGGEGGRLMFNPEPLYSTQPRILRENNGQQPERRVEFDLSHQYIQDSPNTDSSRGNTPSRRPSQPPPAPPPTGTPTHANNRESLPPPPPPPANEMSHMTLNGPMIPANNDVSRVGGSPAPLSSPYCSPPPPSHQQHLDPDLPPPPPAPDQLTVGRIPPAHLAPSPPPPPSPHLQSNAPGAPPAPPPPPPPPPTENGLIKTNGELSPLKAANGGPPKAIGLPGSITSPPGLRKPQPLVRPNPVDNVRSDLLKAIRDGISLKKVEQKEAQDKSGQGLSDVASILARRVAVEFSDSDDCPSDSEYDSDDWGETEA